jgi:aspartyl protease family protein
MLEKLAITATLSAGLAIGWLWPTQRTATTGSAVPATEVVIVRGSDHHYYADAEVNDHPVHFMIDTGASETALTEGDAQKIGISIDPNKYEVIGDGASGMVRGQYVQLKTIDLNGIRQEGGRAVIIQGGSVSLLGQPFLEKVDEILIRGGEMRLAAKPQS